MSKFRRTQSGIAICPFFTWNSENIGRPPGFGCTEDDVNLVHCIHPKNLNEFEGNCQPQLCPLSC